MNRYFICYQETDRSAEKLAKAIKKEIKDAEIDSIERLESLPPAENYIVGFRTESPIVPIHILYTLEHIENANVYLFSTNCMSIDSAMKKCRRLQAF